MDHLRSQMRALLNDTFVAKGEEYSDANDKICMLSQVISRRNVFCFKLFALTSIIPSYLFFAFLLHGWVASNAGTAFAFAIVLCVSAVSVSLAIYIEKQVGYWKFCDAQDQAHANKKHKHEWRFVAA